MCFSTEKIFMKKNIEKTLMRILTKKTLNKIFLWVKSKYQSYRPRVYYIRSPPVFFLIFLLNYALGVICPFGGIL